jgi:hypothetical protein
LWGAGVMEPTENKKFQMKHRALAVTQARDLVLQISGDPQGIICCYSQKADTQQWTSIRRELREKSENVLPYSYKTEV